MKKILILGGTTFVGRLLTEKLIASGKYQLTLFNRGRTNTELFKQVEQIHGDRETADVEKLYNGYWDCVIDFSAYYPNTFEQFLNGMEGKMGRYIFISTISVFNLEKYERQLIGEQFETLACTAEQRTSKLPDAYGEKKAEMERILLKHTGLDKIIFRPSFIYGEYDYTERFYYWLYRVQKCDKFLLPDAGQPKQLSLSNAEDLATALMQAIEIQNHSTIYNAVSTPSTTIRELIGVAAKAYGKQPEIITIDSAGLEKLSLRPNQFPLLLPINFSVGNQLWERDFPFTRADVTSTLLEMRDYNEAIGFGKPKPGLDVEKEKELIGSIA